jgi:tripartite-type tricarboxylate transporter receptor subunit TctC
MRSRSALVCALGAVLALACIPAVAQTYPARPIRFIVPNGMGGTTDTIARSIAQHMSELLGQQIIVDNRPGSGGIIGTELVARAPADGYTWLMGTIGNMAISPKLYPSIGYDPVRDFEPVSQLAASAYMLVVNPSISAHSVKELVAVAKSRAGGFNYASAGSGTGSHLTMELFRSIAGFPAVHVPYKGGTPGLTALVAGEVSLMFNGIPSTLPQVRAGRLRALAVTTSKRSPAAPDVPSIGEAGFPGAESTSWTGLFVPRGTSQSIVQRLHAVAAKTIELPEIRKHLMLDGAVPVGSSPAEFAAYLQSEIRKWAQVVAKSGARAN